MIEVPPSNLKLQTKDEILLRVRRGSMSPEEADLWAAENGQIFSQEPDPARFDPMKLSGWTHPMMASWIITRSLNEVREQWDDFRSEQYTWVRSERVGIVGGGEIGYELKCRETSSLREIIGPYDGAHKRNLWGPRREYEFALRSGQLHSTGFKLGNPNRVPFSPQDWPFRYSIAENEKDFEGNCSPYFGVMGAAN